MTDKTKSVSSSSMKKADASSSKGTDPERRKRRDSFDPYRFGRIQFSSEFFRRLVATPLPEVPEEDLFCDEDLLGTSAESPEEARRARVRERCAALVRNGFALLVVGGFVMLIVGHFLGGPETENARERSSRTSSPRARGFVPFRPSAPEPVPEGAPSSAPSGQPSEAPSGGSSSPAPGTSSSPAPGTSSGPGAVVPASKTVPESPRPASREKEPFEGVIFGVE